MSNLFELQSADRTLVVRFTRPEIRNPLSVRVIEELSRVLSSIGSDVRSVIFTGSGEAFASGADLREIAAIQEDQVRAFAGRGQTLMALIAQLPVTTIAAVNGYCFGGALDLALSCDMRIASPNATFAHPGAGLGIITGWGGTQRLPRLVGTAFANEMFLTASPMNAGRALKIGLVDEIAEDVLPRALELASDHEI